MYIENVTELAFNDITPEDPDFASIQGDSWLLNFLGFTQFSLLHIFLTEFVFQVWQKLDLSQASFLDETCFLL